MNTQNFPLLTNVALSQRSLLDYGTIFRLVEGENLKEKLDNMNVMIFNGQKEFSWMIVDKVKESFGLIKTKNRKYWFQLSSLIENGFSVISAAETNDEEIIAIVKKYKIDITERRIVVNPNFNNSLVSEAIQFYLAEKVINVFVKKHDDKFTYVHPALGEIYETDSRRMNRMTESLLQNKNFNLEETFEVEATETGSLNSYPRGLNEKLRLCVQKDFQLVSPLLLAKDLDPFMIKFSKGVGYAPVRTKFILLGSL